MNQIPPNALYSSNSGINSTNSFVEFFSSVDPTIYDVNFPVQKRWFNKTTNVEWILVSFSTSSGSLTANWQPISTGPDSDIVQYNVLTGGPDHTINSVPPTTAGFALTSNGPSAYPSFQEINLNSESQYATFLVNPTPGEGTHTTIQAAVNASSSGDTIWIYKGTYTENVSIITPGIFLSAYKGSVIILGNLQYDASGTLQINDIILQTNGNYSLSITGTGSAVSMNQSSVRATDHTGILLNTTGGSLVCTYSSFNVSSTGIALFDASLADSTSFLGFINCYLSNGGNSTTPNVYNCHGLFERCFITMPMQSTGTPNSRYEWCYIVTSPTNSTSLTLASAGNNGIQFCFINAGSGSCIVSTAGTGMVSNCTLASSNALAVNASGSLAAYCNSYANNGSTINCVQAAAALGLLGTSPSQFAIGEQIRNTLAFGSAVSLTTNTPANVTSISLTSGTWDVSGIVTFIATSTTVTNSQVGSISSVSNTLGTNEGDDALYINYYPSLTGVGNVISIPALRIFVTTTTTYYLVASSSFTGSTTSAYGRISATRSG